MIWIALLILGFLFYYVNLRVLAFMIFFFFLTGGYQVVPLTAFEGGFLTKSFDYAIIFIVGLFILNIHKNMNIIKKDEYAKYVMIYIVFILSGIGYSWMVLKYDLVYVVRAGRYFLFPLVYFALFSLDLEEITRLVKVLYWITIAQCIIYILQIPANTILMNSGGFTATFYEMSDLDWSWQRYYNYPSFLLFFLFYNFFVNKGGWLKRWIPTSLFIITIICTFHRSLFYATFVSLLVTLVFSAKKNSVKALFLVIVILLISLQFMSIFVERYFSALSDLIDIVSGGGSIFDKQDNLSSRLAHSVERLYFVINSPSKAVFGVGFLTDDSPYTSFLNFYTGGKAQVETSDILWSTLIIQTGLFGTLLFVLVYFIGAKIMLKNIHEETGVMGLNLFVTYFMLTFFGVDIKFLFVSMAIAVFIVLMNASASNSSWCEATDFAVRLRW